MLHQIGIGTLGPVFRTYEPSRDRLVAVKVFRLDIVPEQSKALADALGRAVQASLFHPSIVEPIAAGVEGTVAYRAEEYVAAESLDVAMRHYAPAPIDKVLPFITQLAGAIDFARAAGVGHGGLHPRDIFVTPDDARATGFGVIEALEEIGVRAPVRRPYTAPERIDGQPWSTPADIFSLAAITFELLTGRRPAGTGTEIGALPDGDRSEAVHEVLARAMQNDPARRYGSALAFAAALESASRGESEETTVSDVTAIAAAPIPAAPPARVDRESPPTSPAPASARPPIAPTPGEFEIERRLEPPSAAPDESAASEPRSARAAAQETKTAAEDETRESAASAATATEPTSPTLFDHESTALVEHIESEPQPFADEFSEADREDDLLYEQSAAGEERRPIEPFEPESDDTRIQEQEPSYAAGETALPIDLGIAHESPLEHSDPSHPGVLPMALVGLLALLIGFGLGYYVRGQRPVGSQLEIASASPSTPSAAAAPIARAPTDQSTSPPSATAGASSTPAPSTSAPPVEAPPTVSEAPSSNSAATSAPRTTADARPTPPAAPRSEPRVPAERARTVTVPAAGRLIVHSTPEHAGVVVNGTWRGRTPLTLEKLPFGNYAVRIVEPGYRSVRETVSLNASETEHTVGARLERDERTASPAPAANPTVFTGTLFVDSRPQGAAVLLDGHSIGKTPLTLPDVRIGMHVVRIEMAGKQPWTSTARIVAGETVRVTGSLEDRYAGERK